MTHPHRHPRRHRRRRAFALPIVVLLAMVAAIASLVLLERHANAHLAAQRQIEGYYEHHARQGIKEMIDQWLLTTGGNVADRLLEGGLAFELVADGRTIRVWMEDGQGSLLRRPAGSGRVVEAAQAAADAIAVATGESLSDEPAAVRRERERAREAKNDLQDFERPKLRDSGPLTVSAMSADFDVLVLIAQAAGAGETSAMIASDIVNEREDGQLSPVDIAKACDHAAVPPSARAVIGQLLTVNPTLWRVVAESDEGRWTGLIEQASRGSGLAGSGSSTLLEWERVPEDDDVR